MIKQTNQAVTYHSAQDLSYCVLVMGMQYSEGGRTRWNITCQDQQGNTISVVEVGLQTILAELAKRVNDCVAFTITSPTQTLVLSIDCSQNTLEVRD